MWTVCEFHGSNSNGFGDIWWTDNPIYFSSIDILHNTLALDVDTVQKAACIQQTRV